MSNAMKYFVRGNGRPSDLDRRLAKAAKRKIRCPVCGAEDNDWPARRTLCVDCYCTVLCHLEGTESERQSVFADLPMTELSAIVRRWRPAISGFKADDPKKRMAAQISRSESYRRYEQKHKEERHEYMRKYRREHKDMYRKYAIEYARLDAPGEKEDK